MNLNDITETSHLFRGPAKSARHISPGAQVTDALRPGCQEVRQRFSPGLEANYLAPNPIDLHRQTESPLLHPWHLVIRGD